MGFKIGDIVQMNSGGPLMTISYLSDKGRYTCYWFNETGGAYEIKSSEFRPEMLKAK